MTTRALPVRTAEQRAEALALANARRSDRARYRKQLGALPKDESQRTAAQFLSEGGFPAWAERWPVEQFLCAVKGVGPGKANTMIWRCRIASGRRLGGLTDRQRTELSSRLLSGDLT